MLVVVVVEPASKNAFSVGIHKGRLLYLGHYFFVPFFQDIKCGLAVILVSDGYLARHNVRQRIDKQRGTGKEIVIITDCFEIAFVCVSG